MPERMLILTIESAFKKFCFSTPDVVLRNAKELKEAVDRYIEYKEQ